MCFCCTFYPRNSQIWSILYFSNIPFFTNHWYLSNLKQLQPSPSLTSLTSSYFSSFFPTSLPSFLPYVLINLLSSLLGNNQYEWSQTELDSGSRFAINFLSDCNSAFFSLKWGNRAQKFIRAPQSNAFIGRIIFQTHPFSYYNHLSRSCGSWVSHRTVLKCLNWAFGVAHLPHPILLCLLYLSLVPRPSALLGSELSALPHTQFPWWSRGFLLWCSSPTLPTLTHP